MTKRRVGVPWMSAVDYGRSLRGMSINLLVYDIKRAVEFQTEVLGALAVYSDPDFAVMKGFDAEWMLHAAHTYSKHPLGGSLNGSLARGVGIELRLHGCDPDAAQERARARGEIILAEATDKPHGLREAYLIDPDGYIWVPDVPFSE